MGSVYLNFSGFRAETTMPADDVDRIEATYPGWLDKRLARWSAMIDDRLRKRYAVPFDQTLPPSTVVRWLVDIVTFEAYSRRGWNPTSEQDQVSIDQPMKGALDQLKEAADSDAGLFELPLRDDQPTTSAVAEGGPYGYSEQSPWTWTDVQRVAVDGENPSGR